MYLLVSLLIAAVVTDLRGHRIPNWIIGTGLLAALAGAAPAGLGALGSVVAGAAVGLLLLLPFHALGGMGAGDVKLMAMVGAFTGPLAVLWSVLYTLAGGMVIALGLLLAQGGLAPLLRRYAGIGRFLLRTGRLGYLEPDETEPARQRFPYAVAILAGTLLALNLHPTTGGAAWLP